MKSLLMVSLALIFFLMPLTASQETVTPGVNFSTALPLGIGEYVFNLDVGTLHYFRVDLKKGETLIVALRMPVNQDFDIYLLDPFRQIVDQGVRPAGLTERLGYLAVEDGPHYLVVLGFGGSSGLYTLSISISKPATKTETVTATMTTRLLEVETRLSIITQTMAVERIVTATVTTIRDVERAPWSLLGMAVIGLSVLAVGLSLSGALEKLVKGGERPMPRQETIERKYQVPEEEVKKDDNHTT